MAYANLADKIVFGTKTNVFAQQDFSKLLDSA